MATNFKVVNVKKFNGDFRFIGRQPEFGIKHFGNPFSHVPISSAVVRVATRAEAMSRFRGWIREKSDLDVEPERRAWILSHLHLLEGQNLGCFCKPYDCHGDVYMELLAERRKS